MKIQLRLWVFSLTLEVGGQEDLTVDLVGTHHIPQATYDAGFRWPDE